MSLKPADTTYWDPVSLINKQPKPNLDLLYWSICFQLDTSFLLCLQWPAVREISSSTISFKLETFNRDLYDKFYTVFTKTSCQFWHCFPSVTFCSSATLYNFIPHRNCPYLFSIALRSTMTQSSLGRKWYFQHSHPHHSLWLTMAETRAQARTMGTYFLAQKTWAGQSLFLHLPWPLLTGDWALPHQSLI